MFLPYIINVFVDQAWHDHFCSLFNEWFVEPGFPDSEVVRVNPFRAWQEFRSGIPLAERMSGPEFSVGIGQLGSCGAWSDSINTRDRLRSPVLSWNVLLTVTHQQTQSGARPCLCHDTNTVVKLKEIHHFQYSQVNLYYSQDVSIPRCKCLTPSWPA